MALIRHVYLGETKGGCALGLLIGMPFPPKIYISNRIEREKAWTSAADDLFFPH